MGGISLHTVPDSSSKHYIVPAEFAGGCPVTKGFQNNHTAPVPAPIWQPATSRDTKLSAPSPGVQKMALRPNFNRLQMRPSARQSNKSYEVAPAPVFETLFQRHEANKIPAPQFTKAETRLSVLSPLGNLLTLPLDSSASSSNMEATAPRSFKTLPWESVNNYTRSPSEHIGEGAPLSQSTNVWSRNPDYGASGPPSDAPAADKGHLNSVDSLAPHLSLSSSHKRMAAIHETNAANSAANDTDFIDSAIAALPPKDGYQDRKMQLSNSPRMEQLLPPRGAPPEEDLKASSQSPQSSWYDTSNLSLTAIEHPADGNKSSSVERSEYTSMGEILDIGPAADLMSEGAAASPREKSAARSKAQVATGPSLETISSPERDGNAETSPEKTSMVHVSTPASSVSVTTLPGDKLLEYAQKMLHIWSVSFLVQWV